MSAAGGASRGLKVVDRRRFTEDGQLREGRDIAASAADATARQETREAEEPSIPTSKTFLELIAVLAQQAEMLIAGGPGIARQADQGFRLIEYLLSLESKTRGNLSAEESQALSNTLFQLRALGARENR